VCGRLIRRFGLEYSASAYLAPYESICLLLGLKVLSEIAAALFVRDILCRRIEYAYLADLLRFESNP
jgi:hypothetical protein